MVFRPVFFFFSLLVAIKAYGGEPPFYNKLAERYAPVIFQSTTSKDVVDHRADYLVRFNFDGDWNLANNAEHFAQGKGYFDAAVYYTVLETQTHYFLVYMFYHAVDIKNYPFYGDRGHPHDLEGITLIVEKDGSKFGKLKLVQCRAHSYLIDYGVESELENEIQRKGDNPKLQLHVWAEPRTATNHDRRKPLWFIDESHVAIFINSGSHSVYKKAEKFEDYEFQIGKTGIVYKYKKIAKTPSSIGDHDVSYKLIPFIETMWSKPIRNNQRIRGKFYYLGKRDNSNQHALPLYLAVRSQGDLAATPFWGWREKRGTLYRDAIDPARYLPIYYPILRKHWSEKYLHNPLFGVGR